MELKFAHLLSSVSIAFGLCVTCGCSDSSSDANKLTGGVTDIGNSVAENLEKISGTVTSTNGQNVASARVVAYYDSWDQTTATDSVEAFTDSNGNFTLEVDSSESLVLYAENGDECGLAFASDTNKLVLGNRKSLESSVSGETTGYMRIVGTHEKADIQADGSFAFDSIPPGEISLVYVRDEKPQGYLQFKTTDSRNNIYLPPLQKGDEDGYFYSPQYDYSSYGVDFGYNWNYYDSSYLNVSFHMEGYDPIFDSNHTWVTDSNYIMGISGFARVLKPGQYIELDKQKAIGSNFTISLWTLWNGANESEQVLFSEKITGDSISQLKWFYDSAKGNFAVQAQTPQGADTIYFDASAMTTEGWTFLALVSQEGKYSLFVNGEPVQSAEGSATALELNNTTASVSYFIGGTGRDNATWNGALDEYYIEGYSETTDWIKTIYDNIMKTYKKHPRK